MLCVKLTFAFKMQTIEELSFCAALFAIWLVLNDENSSINYILHILINLFFCLLLLIDLIARLSSFECYITYHSTIYHEIFNNIVIFYEKKS